MRYVNIASVYQLGLTEEEINFLKPLAQQQHDEFCKAHSFAGTRKFNDNLYTGSKHGSLGKMDSKAFVNAEVNHYLCNWAPQDAKRGVTEARFDDQGFGLVHSSYGSVAVSKPSGSRNDLVGSASLFGYYLDMRFSFAEVNVRDVREPHLFTGNEMYTCSLSNEQFFTLLRTNNQPVPCRVQQMVESYPDRPPVLYSTQAKERDYKAELTRICEPLSECLQRFKTLLEAGVSKKAEREAIIEVMQEARSRFIGARAEIDAMTGQESRKEIQRVERQFEVEMSNRLKSLGLEHLTGQVMRLRH
ncbi:hypothetical protein IFT48_01495 [Pseudomonas fluorescens]|uniref:hypothetical protein n=1 Tax=Pseudomonas TaxID=286 RepID=UPI000F023D32|nr:MULTISPECIES: hypothetical protein [Pseudomonas]MBD8088649.1 hypothetical protein [Pseudomonas fluorescens]